MTWAKLDDQFYMGLKNAVIDRDEQDVYIAGLVYCNGQLTDGFIPATKLIQLCVWARVPSEANAQAIASRLVKHEFWEVADGGYMVHDFLDWNPSRAEVLALRDARSEAGRRGGQRSGAARRAHAQANEANEAKVEAIAQAKPNQNPTPSPSPSLGNSLTELRGKGDRAIPPPPPASESAGYGRQEAAKLAHLNGKLSAELRTPLANALLDVTGKRALADAEGVEGDRLLMAAHEAAVVLWQMGVKSETDILGLEPAWGEDWRGVSGGTLKQFLEFVSEQRAGKTGPRVRSNGNGRNANGSGFGLQSLTTDADREYHRANSPEAIAKLQAEWDAS